MTELRADAQTTSAALFAGTTVRYRWRDGAGLATVTEATDDYVSFSGPDCNGRFSRDQIDRLFADRRLEVVLDDGWYASRWRRIPW